MPLKMECQSKWNVTQNEMSIKMECHSKWNITQNGMSLKIESHSKTVDPLEFHWRTLLRFALELYLSSTGVPLENLSSTVAPRDAPGHGQAVPEPGACPGHQTHLKN